MEGNSRESGRPDEPVESLRRLAWVQGPALRVAEHEIVIFGEAAEREAFLEVALSVVAQNAHGLRVQGDGAAPGCRCVMQAIY